MRPLWKGLISGSFLFLATLTHASSDYYFQMINSQQELLLNLPLQEQESWCLLWQHSVAGFLVKDCFVIHQGQWVLTSSHQPDFAAGLGHSLGRGEQLPDGKGGYLIKNMNVTIQNNELFLRVGSLFVNHRVDYRKTIISLSQLAANQRVQLRLVKEISAP